MSRMKAILYGDAYFSPDMAWGFRELGHDAILVGAPRSIDQLTSVLSANEDADFLLTLGSPSHYSQPLLKCLADWPHSTMKYIHWDTDGVTWATLEMNMITLLQPETVFTVCPEMFELLHSRNIRCEMMPYAYNPESHYPVAEPTAHNGQISFLGNAYPNVMSSNPRHYRRRSMDILFRPLLESGARIDIYGDPLFRQVIKSLYSFDLPDEWLHGHCVYNKTHEVYSSAFINLVTQNNENTLTKRVFEILGSGGFALSFNNTAIRQMFTPGKDLEVTSSPAQTFEIIDFYRCNPDQYAAIRQNGLKSIQQHTYRQRAQQVIDQLTLL